MITFGHYGSIDDISGVTTWLLDFIQSAAAREIPFGTVIHYLGSDCTQGSFYRELAPLNARINDLPFATDSETLCKKTLVAINSQRPDVFVPNCLATLHYTAKYAQDFGLPWVFTMHSDDPDYWALAEVAAPGPEHGAWVVVSEHLKEKCKARYPMADVRVIPYGVRSGLQSAKWNHERFRIVFSGRMIEDQKRISLVTQTLIDACKLSGNVEAVLIGDGPDRALAEQIVSENGLATSIKFTGRLSHEALHVELEQAQAILLMSDYEGLPVSLLEGMALGLVPMAKFCDSGIPELIDPGTTGLMLSNDPKEAARSIVELSQQREQWERMSKNSFALVASRYSKSVCMDKWFDLLEELRARSTVQYPIPIPRRMPLPPPDPRLKRMDHRPARSLFVRMTDRLRKSL